MKPRAISFVFLGLLTLAACANSAEGGPCDHRAGNNGADDCQSGLVCVEYTKLNGAVDQHDRCCPVDRTNSTGVCSLSSVSSGADAALPPVPDAGPTDAGSDSGPIANDSGPATDAGDAGAI